MFGIHSRKSIQWPSHVSKFFAFVFFVEVAAVHIGSQPVPLSQSVLSPQDDRSACSNFGPAEPSAPLDEKTKRDSAMPSETISVTAMLLDGREATPPPVGAQIRGIGRNPSMKMKGVISYQRVFFSLAPREGTPLLGAWGLELGAWEVRVVTALDSPVEGLRVFVGHQLGINSHRIQLAAGAEALNNATRWPWSPVVARGRASFVYFLEPPNGVLRTL